MTFSAAAADERVLDVTVGDDALSVSLRDGRVISVPLAWYPRLLNATPAQRNNWKIAGGGYGIHWPDVDEDLSTEGLLRGAPAPKEFRTTAAKLDLSKREQQVLKLITEGCTDKAIASQLKLSEHTVRQYLERLYLKLGTRDPVTIRELVHPASGSHSDRGPSPGRSTARA
jgi:DNA-binding CsgD family transcriptional regulator